MLALFARIAVLAGAALLLTGCVVGQKIPLDTTPQTTGTVGSGYRASVQVEDRREAVLSGKQEPWRIGQYRAAAGIPWSVTTEGKVPLADQMHKDLEEELTSLGFVLAPDGGQLEVFISEWDFTGYQNGRFWCSLIVQVNGPDGVVRYSGSLAREMEIRGTLMLGARGGFERDMPGIYSEVISAIARTNPPVLDALKQ